MICVLVIFGFKEPDQVWPSLRVATDVLCTNEEDAYPDKVFVVHFGLFRKLSRKQVDPVCLDYELDKF